ncbi:unnamed protein product [Acanthosepion pharaonis]|uniref:Uncharacterized protein n=1 Tax=Acanthosepion pharaonis TaxID=158019 RepID=A0A812C340_ACAPH|nr:unnamed protein product [Sepia pharaonis]
MTRQLLPISRIPYSWIGQLELPGLYVLDITDTLTDAVADADGDRIVFDIVAAATDSADIVSFADDDAAIAAADYDISAIAGIGHTDAADRTVGDDHIALDITAAYTAVAIVLDHDGVSFTVGDHDAFLAAVFAASAAGADNDVVVDVVNASVVPTTDVIRMRRVLLLGLPSCDPARHSTQGRTATPQHCPRRPSLSASTDIKVQTSGDRLDLEHRWFHSAYLQAVALRPDNTPPRLHDRTTTNDYL